MHISEINIYPIKSLKGISLEKAKIEPRGLQLDRRWMLTDDGGMFLTQREFPKMATISLALKNGGLEASAAGFEALEIPFHPDAGRTQRVTVWDSICDAEVYDGAVNEWFGDVLQTKCQLVYMPDDSKRSINPRFVIDGEIVSFADGYPFMLLGENSLDNLNTRICESREAREDAGKMPAFQPLPMNRFRPNFVVTGSDAFAEDNWKKIRIGETVFRATKPCERCAITTTDQIKGERDGNEPLWTLATFRRAADVFPETYASFGSSKNSVLFGQNFVAEGEGGSVRIGDEIEIIETM